MGARATPWQYPGAPPTDPFRLAWPQGRFQSHMSTQYSIYHDMISLSGSYRHPHPRWTWSFRTMPRRHPTARSLPGHLPTRLRNVRTSSSTRTRSPLLPRVPGSLSKSTSACSAHHSFRTRTSQAISNSCARSVTCDKGSKSGMLAVQSRLDGWKVRRAGRGS